MADITIPQLNAATSVSGTDVMVISQAGVTKKVEVDKLTEKVLSSSVDILHMNPATVQTLANIGELAFNPDTQTLEVKCSADVTLSIGQENYIRGKNAESSTILNGTVVYISGGLGANSLIKRAGNADGTAERVIGVATQDIGANNIGFITTSGVVNKLNTSAYAEGDLLWLGTNGAMTNVKPDTTVDQICIGVVLRSHATQGSLLVSVKDDWRGQVAQLRSDLSETTDKLTELELRTRGIYDGVQHNEDTNNEFYESCIEELYILPNIAAMADWIDLRSYFNLYLFGYSGDFTTLPNVSDLKYKVEPLDLSGHTNGEVIPLKASTTTEFVNEGDILGYIVFKNISAFVSHYNGSFGNTLSKEYITKPSNSLKIQNWLSNSGLYNDVERLDDNVSVINERVDVLNMKTSEHIYDGIIHEIGTTEQDFYESCIYELYIYPDFVNKLDWIDLRSYVALYLYGWNGDFADHHEPFAMEVANISLDGYNNGDVIPLVTTSTGSLVAKGEIIGYIIFKNISAFKNKGTGSFGNTLNRYYVSKLSNAPKIDKFINQRSNTLDITIPNVIFAVEGLGVNIYNDTVSLSVDRGICSPINYYVGWQSSVGHITDRGFHFIPSSANVGNDYSVKCLVYQNGELVNSKDIIIKVKSKNSLASKKNIVYFGDSTGAKTATRLYELLHNTNKFSGVIPNMLGSRGNIGSDIKYEAVGGYGWSDYATDGKTAYRCYVTNASAIPLHSQYVNNGTWWEVVEVNVTGGSGNILIVNLEFNYEIAPTSSGTLIAGGEGYSNISYNSSEKAPGNPLWDAATNSLSVSKYKNVIGISQTEKIDAVLFQLGLNDSDLGNNQENLKDYIIALYNAFIQNNSNCKFIIGLTTTSGNTANGAGANYGASVNAIDFANRMYNIRKVYIELSQSENFPNMVLAPVHNNLDRYYGYAFSERTVNYIKNNNGQEELVSDTELYHNNFVHPCKIGYEQMGDACFSTFVGVLYAL